MSIDPEKLLFIFVVAVLVLGPERLPQAARTLGRVLGEIRKYTSSFQSEVRQVLAEPKAIIDAAVHEAGMSSNVTRFNGSGPDDGARADGAQASAVVAPAAAGAATGGVVAGPAGVPDEAVHAGAPLDEATPGAPAPPDDPSLN